MGRSHSCVTDPTALLLATNDSDGMETLFVETIKAAFKIGGTLLVSVVVVLFLLSQFPNLKSVVGLILR